MIELAYIWHDGKLLPRDENQFKIPQGKQMPIKIFAREVKLLAEQTHSVEYWRFENAVRHRLYPLEFYPRFYWSTQDKRPPKDPPDVRWGVIGTRNPISGRPFTTACNIDRADPSVQASVVNGEFHKNYSDAKCRGGIAVVKGDKVWFAMIDVWANNARYIDQIYAAAIAELQTKILED
ncbi:MAG TPA: hypothetical protein VLI46_05345 [Ramlibacter sp.]|nr:hypothetical protein [Ramlibacter sp.]